LFENFLLSQCGHNVATMFYGIMKREDMFPCSTTTNESDVIPWKMNSHMSNVRQNCKVVHTSIKLGQHGDSNSRYNGPMEKQITENDVTMYTIACNTPLECCDTNILYGSTCNVSQLKSKIHFPIMSSQLGNQLRSQNQFALTQNSSN